MRPRFALAALLFIVCFASFTSQTSAKQSVPTVGGYAAANSPDDDGVNIRAEPDRHSDRIGAINEGDVVSVLDGPFYDDAGDAWYLIEYDGLTGYAIGSLLTSVEDGSPIVAAASDFQYTAADVGRIPVLMYHHVDYAGGTYSVTPEQLAAQCEWLVNNGYTAITIADFYNGAFNGGFLPARPVVMTIDDGWVTALTFADILSQYGMIGNYFINNTSEVTADQVAYLGSVGEVDDHTFSHAVLSSLGYDGQYWEIESNREYLQSATGQAVQFLAWPYGDWNASAVQAAADSGIIAAFDAWGGPAYLSSLDPWHIPRVLISGDYDLDTFAAVVSA